MSFLLYVKLGTSAPIAVTVHDDDTVHTIKQQICRNRHLDPSKVKVIFQGRQLQDDFVIKDSDLVENSTLHAIVQAPASESAPDEAVGLNLASSLLTTPFSERSNLPRTDHTLTQSERVSLHSSHVNLYYVYCKNTCNKLCPARIRVRCASCKEGTMELSQEPTCWRDVLQANVITGHCLNDGCIGNTAEFYFKCCDHSSISGTDAGVVLPQITANLHDIPCLTCTDTSTPVIVFCCDRHHVMCMECFYQYCITRLDERRFIYHAQHGYTLGCPAGCEDSLITEAHHFRVLGIEQYERYQRFGTEECILREGGVICPAPRCGEGIFPGLTRRVQCIRPECQFIFCRDCSKSYHEDSDCDNISEDTTTANTSSLSVRVCEREEHESLRTIGVISKPCPQCKVPVERDGGCMHMTCSRCGCDWCWLCHVPWSRDCQAQHWFD